MSRVTPAGSGHTTDVQVCSAKKRMMSCATAEIILILCTNDADFTPSFDRRPLQWHYWDYHAIKRRWWWTFSGWHWHQIQIVFKKRLHFIHLSARSLLPKLDELNVLASKTKAAVIGVSETWLHDSVEDSEVELPGYSILRHDRNRKGGGVCIYLRSDLAFNPRQDLQSDGVESVWAEVLLPKTRPILTGICYRPPRQCDFCELLELSFNEGSDVSECILLVAIFLLMLFVILNVYLVLSNWPT